MKKKKYSLERNMNNDIVLCTTGNRIADRNAIGILVKNEVSFTKSEKKTFFLKRLLFDASERIYIISVNRNEFSKARRAIRSLPPQFLDRLSLNAI